MSPRRRHGGSAALVVVLIVALVLVGGLLYGDRYAVREVQERSSLQIQTELGTPQPPEITIEGFPFLTQVVGQNLHAVHVVADDIGSTNDAAVVVAHTDLVLTDIRSDDRFATMTATHAEGTARLDYTELQDLAGLPLTYVGGSRFRFETSTEVLSVPVGAVVTGGLTLDEPDQTISLVDPEVVVAGVTLPDVASKALIRAIVKPVPVSGLPFELRLTSIEAQDDGLHAGVSGENIPLQR